MRFINRVNQRFGKLVIQERVDDYISPSGNRQIQWLCKCDCGHSVVVVGSNMIQGFTKSCGCFNRQIASERNTDNLIGQCFGRLVVVKRTIDSVAESGRRHVQWLCKCDCGEFVCVRSDHLKSGATKSCGCYNIECLTGENNSSWKGGITPLRHAIRESIPYRNWHKQVLFRDNYTCQYSDQTRGNLHVHHKKPFHQILEENNITTIEQALACEELWDVENGITLLMACHKEFHSLYGNDSTLNDFYLWITLRR